MATYRMGDDFVHYVKIGETVIKGYGSSEIAALTEAQRQIHELEATRSTEQLEDDYWSIRKEIDDTLNPPKPRIRVRCGSRRAV